MTISESFAKLLQRLKPLWTSFLFLVAVADLIGDMFSIKAYKDSGQLDLCYALSIVYVLYFAITITTMFLYLPPFFQKYAVGDSYDPFTHIPYFFVWFFSPDTMIHTIEGNLHSDHRVLSSTTGTSGNSILSIGFYFLILLAEVIQDGAGLAINIIAVVRFGWSLPNVKNVSAFSDSPSVSIILSAFSIVTRVMTTWVYFLLDSFSNQPRNGSIKIFASIIAGNDKWNIESVDDDFDKIIDYIFAGFQLALNISIIYFVSNCFDNLPFYTQNVVLVFIVVNVLLRFLYVSMLYIRHGSVSMKEQGSFVGFSFLSSLTIYPFTTAQFLMVRESFFMHVVELLWYAPVVYVLDVMVQSNIQSGSFPLLVATSTYLGYHLLIIYLRIFSSENSIFLSDNKLSRMGDVHTNGVWFIIADSFLFRSILLIVVVYFCVKYEYPEEMKNIIIGVTMIPLSSRLMTIGFRFLYPSQLSENKVTPIRILVGLVFGPVLLSMVEGLKYDSLALIFLIDSLTFTPVFLYCFTFFISKYDFPGKAASNAIIVWYIFAAVLWALTIVPFIISKCCTKRNPIHSYRGP